jgi:hypothetical protein
MRTEWPRIISQVRRNNRHLPIISQYVAEPMTSGPFWLLFSVLALAGCTRSSSDQHSVAQLYKQSAPNQTELARAEQHRPSDNLAYEHTVSIELGKSLLPTRVREIQGACQTDEKFGCTLLDMSVQSAADVPNGTIRIRLAPTGVDGFISLASQNGKVTGRITHAEDLAQQVNDTERELTLLTTHRDRLAKFMEDKSLKIDQLIAVSKELSVAQTQIESASTVQANLHRRIDTNLLTLNLSIPQEVAIAQRTPIRDAFSSFGSEFTEAIAQVIRFVAVLIPWLIVIIPGVALIRLFWRGIGRWLSRRDAS